MSARSGQRLHDKWRILDRPIVCMIYFRTYQRMSYRWNILGMHDLTCRNLVRCNLRSDRIIKLKLIADHTSNILLTDKFHYPIIREHLESYTAFFAYTSYYFYQPSIANIFTTLHTS